MLVSYICRIEEREMNRKSVPLIFASVLLLSLMSSIQFVAKVKAEASEETLGIYNFIESLSLGSVVILNFDYGPVARPENDPQAKAVLFHCKVLGLRVVGVAFWPTGAPIGEDIFTHVYGEGFQNLPEYGTEFVYLGYIAGGEVGMSNFAADAWAAKPTDFQGTLVSTIPLMQNVRRAEDFDFWMEITAGTLGVDEVIRQIHARAVPVGAGCTEDTYSEVKPYYDSGQLVGVLRGLQGAFEYERLLMLKYGYEPATIMVPDDYPTIQEAINNADEGDIIFVSSGTYYEGVVVNRTVMLVGENKVATIIDANWTGDVLTIVSENVVVRGFTIQHGYNGFWLSTSHCSIANNFIMDNLVDGVHLEWPEAKDNIITNNLMMGNDGCAVALYFISQYNTIWQNVMISNYLGIGLAIAPHNFIYDNIIRNNDEAGVVLLSSDNNWIERNHIENNGWNGSLYSSGIFLSFSNSNTIYNNNFVNNIVQAYNYESVNDWNARYSPPPCPSGGNYWSDYNGIDLFNGSYQNETGSDGIGDTPYIIDANNRDNYPIMNPWTVPPTIEIHDVALVDVVSSATQVYVGQVVNITATVQNQGIFTETFTVTCKYELEGIEHIIGVMTINNLAPQANTSIIFTWTTTDITVHTIKAEIPPLTGETDTADNTMTSPTTVKVKILGDINGDGKVDMTDVYEIAKAFGSYPEHPRWNPDADLNKDGKIDMRDIYRVVTNFGRTI